jgi:hypothetical protein
LDHSSVLADLTLLGFFVYGGYGPISSFPNPSADYFFATLQGFLLAVGYALSLTFIGFTAIALSYFRNEKNRVVSTTPSAQV